MRTVDQSTHTGLALCGSSQRRLYNLLWLGLDSYMEKSRVSPNITDTEGLAFFRSVTKKNKSSGLYFIRHALIELLHYYMTLPLYWTCTTQKAFENLFINNTCHHSNKAQCSLKAYQFCEQKIHLNKRPDKKISRR